MRLSLLSAGLAVAIIFGPCLAEAVPLPVERSHEARRLVLDLHDGRVEVTVGSELDPVLRIDDLVNGASTTGFALLEEAKRGVLRVGQPHGDDAIAPRLAVEVVLAPGQMLFIRGDRLSVSVRDERRELREEAREQIIAAAGRARAEVSAPGGLADALRIEVNDSDVTLSGVVAGKLRGRGTRYILDACRGPMIFDLEEGSADISAHWGSLHISGQDSDFHVTGGDQVVEYSLLRGSLTVSQAMGTLHGSSLTSDVFVDQWDGDMNLGGQANQMEIMNSGHESSEAVIKGEDEGVRLEAVDGALSFDLQGGSVEGERFSGKLTLRGSDGARFDLRELMQGIHLELKSRASARLESVAKGVKVELNDADLVAKDVGEFGGKASASMLSLSELLGRLRLVATDGEVDLDLSESSAVSFQLELEGDAQARVALRDPCRVKLKSSDQARQSAAVTGCQLLEANSRRPAVRRIQGGPAPVTLNVSIDDGVDLEVWSR